MKSINLQHTDITFTLHISAAGKFDIHRIYLINKEVIESKENHYCNGHKTYTA
jgi:hypothetical protein